MINSTDVPKFNNKLRPICFSGPSGSGKSTLLKMLMREYPKIFSFSISHTTRKPRPKEIDGKDYYFVSREEMIRMISTGDFLEHAEYSGNLYGTSKYAIESVLSSGRLCALDIDIQGVEYLKKTNLNPIFCFVKAPNMEILERRLRNRCTESEEDIIKRLEQAKIELEYEKNEKSFHFTIINDDLNSSYEILKKILSEQIELCRNEPFHELEEEYFKI